MRYIILTNFVCLFTIFIYSSILSKYFLVRAIVPRMASYNSGGGSRSGGKGRGRGRSGRGRSQFSEQELSDQPAKYPLRSTQSRISGFTDCFDDPNPIHETGEYSRKKGRKSPKASPRNVNKNTHVVYFWRIESPYSQFHSANFTIKDTDYSCAEQFMMSSKARIFNDSKSLNGIMSTKIPAAMKRFGRGVSNFDQNIWKMCCRQFVQEGNIAKFSQNPYLLEELLSTEDRYLAEASPSDKVWGIGMAENNPQANNPSNWKGSNWLGEALNLVKFEFQTIICLIFNKDDIKEVPEEELLDLFKVGRRDYFDKMKCQIIISDDEVPSRILASKRSSKFSQRKKRPQKSEEINKDLAPNFDVQPPGKDETKTSEKEKDHESDSEENSFGEKLKSREGTEFPQNSDQEQTPQQDRKSADEKKSPLPKRKTSPKVEEAQFSKEKPKLKKIIFDVEAENPIIPASLRTAVEYILTDWVRLKLINDMPLLKCFMDIKPEQMKLLTGMCAYQTDFEVINPVITISSILTNLQKEFNQLQHIFASQTNLINDFNCATNPPVFPTQRPNPKERSKISSWFSKKSKSTPPKVRSSKKLDTSAKDTPETLDEPDDTGPEITEISPVRETPTKDDTDVITPDKPIEGDNSVNPTSTPEEPTAENIDLLSVEPDKSVIPMELDKSAAENTEVVSKKEITNKDVTPTSSSDSPSEGKERKRNPKKKKKSTEDDGDTDSAKRHKNNSEPLSKLVPYASSSLSDQDSPKESGENKNPSKSEKSHSSKESSPVTKIENKSDTAITLDQSEVKEKPVETETTMDTEEDVKETS